MITSVCNNKSCKNVKISYQFHVSHFPFVLFIKNYFKMYVTNKFTCVKLKHCSHNKRVRFFPNRVEFRGAHTLFDAFTCVRILFGKERTPYIKIN